MACVRPILFAVFFLATNTIAAADDQDTSVRSGEAVFEAHCANCHTGGFGGFFTGAPKVGKKKDWESLAPKGVDTLTANTTAGTEGMPPRAECAACTDDEIRAAVEYMLEESH